MPDKVLKIFLILTAFILSAGVAEARTLSNKEVAKKFAVEGLGQANPKIFDELIDENVEVTTGLSPKAPIKGLKAYKEVFMQFAEAFPVKKFELHQIIANGDNVTVIFTATGVFKKDYYGVKATRQIIPMTEIQVYTLQKGKIVKSVVGAVNYPFEYIMYPALKDAVLGDLKVENDL